MNKINTTIPIGLDQLQEYFNDEEGNSIFIIDYNSSMLKGEELLIYLSNLDANADIVFDEETEYEDKAALLKAYITTDSMANIPSLQSAYSLLMLKVKAISESESIESEMMNKQEFYTFIQDNKELLTKVEQFFDSLTVYPLVILNGEDKAFQEVLDGMEVIDDRKAIGDNFVYLLSHPAFFLYYKELNYPPKYYKQQFEEYIFKGYNLFKFFDNEVNPLAVLTQSISAGQLDTEVSKQICEDGEAASLVV